MAGKFVPARSFKVPNYDGVFFPRGGVATIACIVETKISSGFASLVRVGHGLEVTPWHPIKGSDGLWRFPCEVT
jgi:hypothetical protein